MKKNILKNNKKQEKGGEQMDKKQRKTVDNKTAVLIISIVLFLIVIVACAVLPEQRDVVSQISEVSEVNKEKIEETVRTGEYSNISISGTTKIISGQTYYNKDSGGATVYVNYSYLDYRTTTVIIRYRIYYQKS